MTGQNALGQTIEAHREDNEGIEGYKSGSPNKIDKKFVNKNGKKHNTKFSQSHFVWQGIP